MHNNLTYSAVWRPQAAPSADAGAVRNALSPIDHREIQAPAARLAATSLCRIQQPIDSIRPSADWNSSEHGGVFACSGSTPPEHLNGRSVRQDVILETESPTGGRDRC